MKLCSFIQKIQKSQIKNVLKLKPEIQTTSNETIIDILCSEKEKNNKKKQLFVTDVLDKQSHTVTYMQTHTHPLRKGTYDLKKAVQSEKDLSIHSISVTEVLERPFSSDRYPATVFGKQPAFQ